MEKQTDALWAMYVTALFILVENKLVTLPDLLNRLRLARQGLSMRHGEGPATVLIDATVKCFERPSAEIVPIRG